MKKQLVELELLEKGDKVLLPDGEAIVVRDEKFNKSDRFYSLIKVKWIDNCRDEKVGKTESVSRANCILIKE